MDAVLVPGGFGVRGIEGKVGALRWAREKLVPTLGICLGLQCMVIEYARDGRRHRGGELDRVRPGHTGARHRDDGGAEGVRRGRRRPRRHDAPRLAAGGPLEGSVVAGAYGATHADERHRHRYEVNESYREALQEAGLVISGTHPDLGLVEFVELPSDVHPYYVSTQAHPEFKSRPTRAHPLFAGLIGAAIEQQRAARLVEVERPRHHEPAEANA